MHSNTQLSTSQMFQFYTSISGDIQMVKLVASFCYVHYSFMKWATIFILQHFHIICNAII